jgi:ligand-binding sensor domain-containing protein
MSGPSTTPVTCFCIADGGSTIIAGTHSGVFVGGSGSWIPVNRNLTSPLVAAIATNGTDIFIGTVDGAVYSSASSNWNTITPNSGISEISSVAAIQGNLYVGTDGAFWKSSDKGAHWTQPVAPDPTGTVTGIAGIEPNVFAIDNGVYLTHDDGTTWANVSTGLPTNVLTLTATSTQIFAGTNDGVYLSTNNGTSWTPINNGMTGLSVTSVATEGVNLYAATQANGVYFSGDNGADWQTANTALPTMKINTLAIAGLTLIVATDADGVWQRPLSQFVAVKNSVSDPTQPSVEVSLSPNPTHGMITVRSGKENISRILVRNLLGREVADVFVSNLPDCTLDLPKVPAGLYLATVITSNSVVSKKLILQ